jgi:hypothetical protein
VLEAKLETLRNAAHIDYNAVEVLLDDAIMSLTKLNTIFCISNISEKRNRICSNLETIQ